MSTITDAEVRTVPAVHVAQLTRPAPGFGPENIPPVVGPMFPEVERLLEAAGVQPVAAPIAVYAAKEPGGASGVDVTVAYPVPDSTTQVPGLEVTTLPAIEQAAVTVYHGAMSGIGDAWTAFMHWVEQQGYALPPVCREVYLTGPGVPEEDWDTELIQPVTAK